MYLLESPRGVAAERRRDAAAWRSFSDPLSLLTVSHITQRRPRPRSPNDGLTQVIPDIAAKQSAIQAGRQTIHGNVDY
jgi:hypothetical protein